LSKSKFGFDVSINTLSKGVKEFEPICRYSRMRYGTAFDRYNVLVGAYSGYRLTTGVGNIILGYQSGYDATYSPTTGFYNILIGYKVWPPATSSSNFLNIGGLVFGTNLRPTPNKISPSNSSIGKASLQKS
jgi:hypothetical protein